MLVAELVALYFLLVMSIFMKFSVIRLSISIFILGCFILYILYGTTEEPDKQWPWHRRLFKKFGIILILSSCTLGPIIHMVHQEYHEEEVIDIIEISSVTKKTSIDYVPPKKGVITNGKYWIPWEREGYTQEEVMYECYSEDGKLLRTFSADEIKIEYSSVEEQRIEIKYKDSWKINHVSDLLGIQDEINFIKGKCLNSHEIKSYTRIEEERILYIDSVTIHNEISYR